jgi:hypothetical protein
MRNKLRITVEVLIVFAIILASSVLFLGWTRAWDTWDCTGADCTFSGTLTANALSLPAAVAPGWQGKDSNTTDSDVNGQWYVDCSTTGSGAEVCYFTFKTQNQGAEATALIIGGQETHTSSTKTLTSWGNTELDASGGNLTALTLGSGSYIGQVKTLSMSTAPGANSAIVTVTNHQVGDGTTYTFDAADEFVMLVWTGTEWATVLNQDATEA